MQATLAPVGDSQRLPALDAARGFALLGILMVNIQLFGEPFGEFVAMKPEAEQGWPAWVSFYFVKIFCEYKFFTLFSTLFGMGLAIQFGRAVQRQQSFGWLGARRIFALGVIGFLHATLLWAGDILFIYALAAVPLLFLVRRTARTLLIIAAVLMLLATLMSGCFGAILVMGEQQKQSVVAARAEQANAGTSSPSDESTQPKDETSISAESAAAPTVGDDSWKAAPFDRLWKHWQSGKGGGPEDPVWNEVEVQCFKHGPTRDAILMRSMEWLMILFVFAMSGGYFWIVAMFATGAALLKLDIFGPSRRPWLKKMVVYGWGIGIPVSALCVFFGVSMGTIASGVLGMLFIVPASSAVALGTLAAMTLLATSEATARFTKPFANVGRLGLTNYLLQTAICTMIFYYWGFGLFDSLTRIERVGVVISVYVLQLILSAVWLQFFRMGPMEWLWRTFTYLKPQSLMRGD